MRTTIEIDDDLFKQLKETAHKSGVSLKKIVNSYLRIATEKRESIRQTEPYKCQVFSMGKLRNEAIDIDKALQLADALEDGEILRKLELRK